MAAVGALLTSFYMFRLAYLTFYGSSRMDPHTAEHVHESPMVMVAPLMVLAFLSIVGASDLRVSTGAWLVAWIFGAGRRGEGRA